MTANRVKKITAVLCALICVIGSVFVCSAATQRYTISEIDDMVIYLPDDMSAITRSSKESDRYFSVFGLDYDSTMQNFKNGDIYLQGMDSLSAVTVTVTMTETSDSKGIGNYNLLDDEHLQEISSNFLSQSEYTECTADSAGQIVWLNFNTNVKSNGLSIKAYQANTVYDGMSVSVTLQRNSGNVTAEDYQTFTEIVSSVNFMSEGFAGGTVVYIIIGVSVAVIVLVVLLTVLVKRAKKRRKKEKNNRIIEELAGKYNNKGSHGIVHDEDYSKDDDGFYEFEDEPVSERIDTEIEADEHNMTKSADDSEIEEILSYRRMVELKKAEDAKISKAELVYSNEKYADEQTDDELPEENEESKENEKQKPDKIEELENTLFGEADETDDEDFNNDEELIRIEAKRVKFNDSDDFFEEAPKKAKGVISSRDILDAEDFDVIEEVEEKAKNVERQPKESGKKFIEAVVGFFAGVKSFGIHFGYFCTNLSRMIKQKRAMKKRQKAEQERRERARRRAERQKAQMRELNDNGLVRVHHRTTQRPQGSNQKRRPSPQQGRNRNNSPRR